MQHAKRGEERSERRRRDQVLRALNLSTINLCFGCLCFFFFFTRETIHSHKKRHIKEIT